MKIFICYIVFCISFSACKNEAAEVLNASQIDTLVQSAKDNGHLSEVNRIGTEVKKRFEDHQARFNLCLQVGYEYMSQNKHLAEQMKDSAEYYMAEMAEDKAILNIILK